MAANDPPDPLPSFNGRGYLRPHLERRDATDRAALPPFHTSALDFARRFARTPARRGLCRALMDLRLAMRSAGLVGFQWISGSFVEASPAAPTDLDVVSFVALASPLADPIERRERWSELSRRFIGDIAGCDAYLVDLSQPGRAKLVRDVAYWTNVFGHRRTLEWRGFIELSLDTPDVDVAALAWLDAVAS